MFAQGKVTTDRSVIKKWVKARRGWPAVIRQMSSAGMEWALSIVFPGHESNENTAKITWDEFFERFDQQNLAFVYQETDSNRRLSLYYAFV